jgi:hypothetical protein
VHRRPHHPQFAKPTAAQVIRETRNSTIAALKEEPKLAALRRSLDVYYGDSVRDAAMDKLYSRFIRSGDQF